METKKQLQANEFEEKVYDYFNDVHNIPLSHFVSKNGQFKRGENRQGFEIKNDQMFNKTGNLYISVKRVYDNIGKEYPSGIYRETETSQLFYIIGDSNNFWVIATKHLRSYYEENNLSLVGGFKSATGGQEFGFLLSTIKADRLCAAKHSIQTKLNLTK